VPAAKAAAAAQLLVREIEQAKVEENVLHRVFLAVCFLL